MWADANLAGKAGDRTGTQEVAMGKNDKHAPVECGCMLRTCCWSQEEEGTRVEDDGGNEHCDGAAPEAGGFPGHVKRSMMSRSKEMRALFSPLNW